MAALYCTSTARAAGRLLRRREVARRARAREAEEDPMNRLVGAGGGAAGVCVHGEAARRLTCTVESTNDAACPCVYMWTTHWPVLAEELGPTFSEGIGVGRPGLTVKASC